MAKNGVEIRSLLRSISEVAYFGGPSTNFYVCNFQRSRYTDTVITSTFYANSVLRPKFGLKSCSFCEVTK